MQDQDILTLRLRQILRKKHFDKKSEVSAKVTLRLMRTSLQLGLCHFGWGQPWTETHEIDHLVRSGSR